MQCRVAKWGNSYAIRIPKEIIDEFGLYENSELQIQRMNDTIMLKQNKDDLRLRELLQDISPQEEFDWGEPRGKEFW